ncbi:DNA modification methylase [Microbacterium capsulatum]|uniref:DNA modification methylase n=1 Tax=Microbacterium capsulatum TaxID=3041921 RepID=A0ABU0XH38_9MICO|nr:DNA modification methylase [Microbacterium sp. ASV81]MDQ4214426.1 DNA modification methylase [Microbacterium sp. ASV81]
MKSRLAASIALSALVIVGATGCSMIAPQATTIDYSASDGANIPKSGPIEVRNAFVVVNKSGTTGNLVAGLVNVTSSPATIHITIGDGPGQSVRVPAQKAVSLGGDEEQPLRFEGIDTQAGATIEVYFQSGDAQGVKYAIPVLDGTLPYYSKLVPSPLPKPVMTPMKPMPTPSPTS